MLLARFRRKKILRDLTESNRKGETMNSFAAIERLFANDMFTLNMGGVNKKMIATPRRKRHQVKSKRHQQNHCGNMKLLKPKRQFARQTTPEYDRPRKRYDRIAKDGDGIAAITTSLPQLAPAFTCSSRLVRYSPSTLVMPDATMIRKQRQVQLQKQGAASLACTVRLRGL